MYVDSTKLLIVVRLAVGFVGIAGSIVVAFAVARSVVGFAHSWRIVVDIVAALLWPPIVGW